MITPFYLYEDLIIIPSTEDIDKDILYLLNIDEKSIVKDFTHEITVINLFKNKVLNGDYDNE